MAVPTYTDVNVDSESPDDQSDFRRVDLHKTVVLRRNNSHKTAHENGPTTAVSGLPLQYSGKFSPVAKKAFNVHSKPAVARRPSSPARSISDLSHSPQSAAPDRGMWLKQNGLSSKPSTSKEFDLSVKNTVKGRRDPQPTRIPPRPASPVVKPVMRRTSSSESRFDHTLKSNNRINMSFENSKYWEIEKTNRFLAERIQNTKPTYSRRPSESSPLRSRFELRQSKDFFSLQRDNMRIATKIVQAKPTVPPARPKSSAGYSRPSSSASTFNYSSVSRSGSYSNLQKRPDWSNRW